MWEPIVINNSNYLLKCKQDSHLHLLITDLKEIYVERLSRQELASRFSELNPLFDSSNLEEEELMQYVISMIKSVNGDTSITLTENEHLIVELSSNVLESLVTFKFTVKKTDATTYFNEFTLPLMQSVQYLEKRQKMLFDQLEKKDKEIQEHVLENGEITRKVLITKKFDRNNIMKDVPQELLVNVFGKSKQFYETFSQNYGVIKFNVNVKKEDEPVRKKLKK